MGWSTGNWEGRTLVIETTMLSPGWLDGSGYPMSGGATRESSSVGPRRPTV